jgi:23S rRNA (uracil1939-C5)-methyltransferase
MTVFSKITTNFASQMKKNRILEQVTIESIAAEGKALARVDDKVIFVKGVAPGDVVDLRITRKKKSFMEGVPIKFHQYSKDRIEPFCSHFGVCGGCKWQFLPYDIQLAFKQQQVDDQISRLGKVEGILPSTILPSEKTQYYRNKLEFTFSNNRWLTKEEIDSGEVFERSALGFHIPGRFDKVLQIEHCYLQDEPSNAIRNSVYEFAIENGLSFYDIRRNVGLLRNLVIRTSSTGEVMVILQVGENNVADTTIVLDHLAQAFPTITSLNYVINLKLNDSMQDQEVINYQGRVYIEESMLKSEASDESLIFRIGPKSFYQTNSDQAYQLYRLTRELAQLEGHELVYDLYTGTGTIANFVAHQAAKVIGIEYVKEAIEDAKINSEINGITNTEFFAGDMKDLLNDDFIADHGQPDVVIVDPPRAGMHGDVVAMLNKLKAKRIVYVSCNPATQARDIEMMKDTYEVKTLQPVDMFPQTHHVENIAVLELK